MLVDRSLADLLNRLAQHGTIRVIALVSAQYLLIVPVLAVVAAAINALRRRDVTKASLIAVTVAGTAAALALNQVVGRLVFRARPYWAVSSIHALGTRATDSSFYSDHATLVAGLTLGLFFVARRGAPLAAGCAFFVAVGRVAVGAHYPSDVVVGACIGCAAVAGLLRFRPRIEALITVLPCFRRSVRE